MEQSSYHIVLTPCRRARTRCRRHLVGQLVCGGWLLWSLDSFSGLNSPRSRPPRDIRTSWRRASFASTLKFQFEIFGFLVFGFNKLPACSIITILRYVYVYYICVYLSLSVSISVLLCCLYYSSARKGLSCQIPGYQDARARVCLEVSEMPVCNYRLLKYCVLLLHNLGRGPGGQQSIMGTIQLIKTLL